MNIEMHSHTSERSSCSHVAAADMVRRAFEQGLQGIVFTDHHSFWTESELARIRLHSHVPKYFLLFSGQEVTTGDFGDILIYGADRTIPKGTRLEQIRREFPEAALVWAHPYRDEKTPSPERLLDPRLDAVEIFNSNHTSLENHRALQDWHRYRFTAIAGTDTHALSYTGTFPTQFDHPISTVEELAAEVRLGRCRPFFKEIPREGSNLRITELTIGTGRAERPREKIVVKALDAEKWETADRASHIMGNLLSHGFETGQFRIPRVLARDDEHLTLIEEGIHGKTLHDKLICADDREARRYLEMAARWLARLHNCRLLLTPCDDFLEHEAGRMEKYSAAFTEIGHRFTRRAKEIADTILTTERQLFRRHPHLPVQGHGDFNPKNILIGRDNPDDPGTSFVAVIDFDDSHCMLPAFDVGTFIAQFRNQFFHNGDVLRKVSETDFLRAYLDAAEGVSDDFPAQLELYRARANMSIAYYLIMVGLGDSENLWRVLVEADHALARVAMGEVRKG